jgi:hypothetical protein
MLNSMSFGDYSFAEGHDGITHKMSLKYTRNTTLQMTDMSPRGDGPLTSRIRARKRGE